MNVTYDIGFLRCIVGFFMGQLTYIGFKRFSGNLTSLPNLLECGAILSVIIFIHYCGDNKLSLFAPFVFSLTVFIFAHEEGVVSALLKTKPFRVLGEISYSIYLVHSLVLIVLYKMIKVLEKYVGDPLYVEIMHRDEMIKVFFYANEYFMDILTVLYLAIVIVIVVAIVTYNYIEVPGRLFFNKFAKARELKQADIVKALE